MSDAVDLAHLPNGQLGWRTLVEQLSRTDVTSERHFLELKSDVDLSVDDGRAKVAKFVLGAANRDPARAASRFDGCALMVLGVGDGDLPGIPSFEAMDLQRYVRRFTGTPGPQWDFERIDVGDRRAVIAIVVGPPDPEKQPWVCEGEGPAKLFNGRIYIRGDGDTREATAAEFKEMIDRSKVASRPDVAIEVGIVGASRSYTWNPDLFDDYLERKRAWLLDALPKPPPQTEKLTAAQARAMGVDIGAILAATGRASALANLAGFASTPEPRTEDQYREEVDAWVDEARRTVPGVLDRLAGRLWRGVRIRLQNLTDTYLDEPEFQIHLDGPVEALDTEEDVPDLLDDIGRPPRRWGPVGHPALLVPSIAGINPYVPNFAAPQFDEHGTVRFENGGSVTLTLSLTELRPRATWQSDDDFVLAVRQPGSGELQGTWQATVRGHHAVYSGALVVPVREGIDDFGKWIQRELAADEDVSGNFE